MDKEIEKAAKYVLLATVAVTAVTNLNQFSGVSHGELLKDVVDETARQAK